MHCEPKDEQIELLATLRRAAAAAGETEELVGGGFGSTDYYLRDTATGGDGPLYFQTRNPDLRIIRYSPLTAPPTAFVTLNFDYSFFQVSINHFGIVFFEIKDVNGNLLQSIGLKKFFMGCGSKTYNDQAPVDPKYFDVAQQVFFRIRWGSQPGALFDFKACP